MTPAPPRPLTRAHALPPRKLLPRARRGSVILAAALALALLQLAVMLAVLGGARDQALASRRLESVRAVYAAEAGLAIARREFETGLDLDASGAVGAVASRTLAAIDPALAGTTLSVSAATAAGATTLTATGASAQALRRAQLSLRPAPAAAVAGNPGVLIYGWNSAANVARTTDHNWSSPPDVVGHVPFVHFMFKNSSVPIWQGNARNDRFAIQALATLTIPTAGSWTFSTRSDDGSVLRINGAIVVDNDGLHSSTTRSGTVTLAAGTHDLDLRWFDRSGESMLNLLWQGPGMTAAETIPASAFSFTPPTDAAGRPLITPLALDAQITLNASSAPIKTNIDAYDASAGPYGSPNVNTTDAVVSINATSSGAWTMNSASRLQGHARVGVGGNHASVITLNGGSTITGTRAALERRQAILTHTQAQPTTLNALGTLSTGSSQTWNSHRSYTSVQLNGDATITIQGHISVAVNGTMQINNNARINIAPNSSLMLHVTQPISFNNASSLNANTGDPSLCWVFINAAQGADALTLNDNSTVVAHVRASRGNLVLNGTPRDAFRGTFRGRALTMNNDTRLNLDLSLFTPNTTSPGAATGPADLLSWTELDPIDR